MKGAVVNWFGDDHPLVPGTSTIYARSQSEVLRRKSAQSESSVCPEHFRLGGL
jgi:hypothetical protein